MSRSAVLYPSKYGATRRYAQWLAEARNCEIIAAPKTRIECVKGYDAIFLGGGI